MLNKLENVRVKPIGYVYALFIMMAVCRVMGI